MTIAQAQAEEKQILSCKSVTFDVGHDQGKKIVDPVLVAVYFNHEEEPNYRLVYEGPAYTMATDGKSQVVLTSKTASVTFPMGSKGEKLLNFQAGIASAAQQFRFSVNVSAVAKKTDKRDSYLRYYDGKPIAIEASLKCVEP